MNRKYLRKGFDAALAHAIEEAGEFIASAGKTDRFGLFMVNPELPPDQQETNHDWMRREMRDLRGALNRLGAAMRAEVEQRQKFDALIARNRGRRPGYNG